MRLGGSFTGTSTQARRRSRRHSSGFDRAAVNLSKLILEFGLAAGHSWDMKKMLMSAAAAILVSNGVSAAAASPQYVKLEQFRRSVAFRVNIAGKERLFQFDTGGGISFISPEIAKDLKCEKGAQVVGFRMTGDKLVTPRCDNVKLSIGGKPFIIPLAGVADL